MNNNPAEQFLKELLPYLENLDAHLFFRVSPGWRMSPLIFADEHKKVRRPARRMAELRKFRKGIVC